ncbi:LysR family transcriptional regulator [Achromobacter anxifer]|jgi:DNA-binding transcriptional LysR family regulator|uniref:HTH-type transcriptional regulator ArgP n=1 Tax=Achromobacter anxifer TaxID=1287737 RepID=A0A6S7E454_9BURK|nr:LysR substrate-binding domain-containing protein [Achromobacter anxifer]MDF8361006.1 LysR substrate-binding domain-containing protein [Achromobacter anxifer]CAB3894910.1 HTH-type transcriptional regulator ArgP [Achromobacter anxifer]CAB5516346.1 HTH-type transcriptional regulator ArgP [Achromobacter anxifer]
MSGFDLDQLRTLVAVLDAGSLTAAAPKVFLSQSSVSEQMRKLEERAGQPLLLRGKAGVVATPAGERLLAHARGILALSDEAYRDLRGVALRGQLRLCITDYFRPGDVARMLRRLNEQYPQVRLHVTIMKSGAIEAAYERGEIDVGISMRIMERGAARGRASGALLRREPLLWMSADGAAAPEEGVLPLLVLPETCALRQYVERLLSRRDVPYSVAHVASGVAGLQLAVAAGLGVACLNESALGAGMARLHAPGLPALPMAEFRLLPARAGESEFIGLAREAIVKALG